MKYSHKKKNKKKNKYLLFISVISFIVLFTFFITYIFIDFLNSTATEYHTSNIENYGDFSTHNEVNLYSNLSLFPRKLFNDTYSYKYKYSYKNNKIYPSYQIYLDAIYSSSTFEKEISRLNDEAIDGTNLIYFNDETKRFNFPFFVYMYEYNYTYEYALIDKENLRIIYIYLQNMNKNDILFDDNFLPTQFANYNNMMNLPQANGISVYILDY